ncbi:MAG TPA: alkaline phosphatase family protein [Ktedonobacterales bacterium]|nr:alkaline phosphatase family protein [Ktedonobacterales bacterium]
MARGWLRERGMALAASALIVAVSVVGMSACALGEVPSRVAGPMPRYDHIFVIVMENSSYDDIIGSGDAPRINALANEYGQATNYWGVTHPSEPNYVAMIGGDSYGIKDDNSYTVNALTEQNLATQLEAAGLTWKSYQQSLPYPGFTGETYPSGGALYASKHNPFMNFLGAWPASEQQAALARNVPDTQLARDLASGAVPNFAFISPDLCHDMHGAPSCDSDLRRTGDTYVGDTVDEIMRSSVWQTGNTAIVITWDETDAELSFGAPNIAADGGHVPTVVITNHGPRGAHDALPYNHFALLLTIQDAFGLGCLRNSCPETGNISPMTPLFALVS